VPLVVPVGRGAEVSDVRELRWRPLGAPDSAELVALAGRCLAADGGLPLAATAEFLARRYGGDATATLAGFTPAGRLVAATSVRWLAGPVSVVVGQVDPAVRGRGLGARLLDWSLGRAAWRDGPVRVETESLTQAAVRLYAARGFRQAFAEDVMRRALGTPIPAAPLPEGVGVEEWGEGNRGGFFAAYAASFADRPGFPGWSQAEWVAWTTAEGFRPPVSLLARDASGAPVGFVTCAEDWVVQVGVVPAVRGQGLGRALTCAALSRMRVAGDREAWLDVNVDNPTAAGLYASLGFTVVGRRARFERGRPAAR
jgi:mycothiol synthase